MIILTSFSIVPPGVILYFAAMSALPNYRIAMARWEDVPGMLRIYAPFVKETIVSFETEVPTEQTFWSRVQQVQKEAPWLVCLNGNEIAGYAYASAHRSRQAYQWTRELSVYVAESHRGRRIATALYQTLIEILRLQGFANALIGISLPNEVSVAFHESMGFEPVGVYHGVGYKDGQFRDVGWWEMRIRDQPGEIKAPDKLSPSQWEQVFLSGLQEIRV